MEQVISDEQKALFFERLKAEVIEACNVKDCTPADVANEDTVIGGTGKLALDSLDALEIVMMIEQRFGIRLGGDAASRDLFRSFDKLGQHILKEANEEKLRSFLS